LQRAELSPAQVAYLDFVRALGAVMVLLGHAAHYLLPANPLASGHVQQLGVYIFFFISGFLISLSVLQKLEDPRYGFSAYFIDRFCRIYSAFLPALILVVVLDTMVVDSPAYQWRRDFNLQTWFGNLAMLQDFPAFQVLRRLGVADQPWMVASFGSGRPFWTISIEWWIYMAFGGVMFFIARGRLGLLALAFLAFAAIEPLYHFVGGPDHCLTMLWVAGMGAAFLFHKMPALRRRFPALESRSLARIGWAVALVSALCIVARLVNNRGITNELQVGLYLGCLIFALFFALGFSELRVPALVAMPIGFVAGYSYSLYLVHHSLLEYVTVRQPELVGQAWAFWAAILASNLLALAFWWLFERHHRQLARALKGWWGSGKQAIGARAIEPMTPPV
jgi:peptidoglycan/LPS O-acetylase OafA/YrhL